MSVITWNQWLLVLAFATACLGSTRDDSRQRVASALRDTLGKAADPQVAFMNNSRHLLIQLSTAAFVNASDSTFAQQAKDIARFAFRRYEKASGLDSITVLDRNSVAKGVWQIRYTRTFPVKDLRNLR
jgi:hypothetical protein